MARGSPSTRISRLASPTDSSAPTSPIVPSSPMTPADNPMSRTRNTTPTPMPADWHSNPIGTGQIVDSNPTPAQPAPGSGESGPPPTPTMPNWPKAADGTDVSACYDGTCEVELRAPVTIPMDPSTGIASLSLDRVDDVDGAQLSGTDVNGGTFHASLYVDPGSGIARTNLNGFLIEALATANGRAVLRMSPA